MIGATKHLAQALNPPISPDHGSLVLARVSSERLEQAVRSQPGSLEDVFDLTLYDIPYTWLAFTVAPIVVAVVLVSYGSLGGLFLSLISLGLAGYCSMQCLRRWHHVEIEVTRGMIISHLGARVRRADRQTVRMAR